MVWIGQSTGTIYCYFCYNGTIQIPSETNTSSWQIRVLDDELQRIFEDTKLKLCDLVEKGLSFYDVHKQTAVVTDWSRAGIGFVICQKHCKCPDDLTATKLCCAEGWHPIFCKSRHLEDNEKDFRPIEG